MGRTTEDQDEIIAGMLGMARELRANTVRAGRMIEADLEVIDDIAAQQDDGIVRTSRLITRLNTCGASSSSFFFFFFYFYSFFFFFPCPRLLVCVGVYFLLLLLLCRGRLGGCCVVVPFRCSRVLVVVADALRRVR